MGFMDSLRNWWDPGAGVRQAAGNVQMPYFQADRDRLGGLLAGGSPYGQAAQVGQGSYAGDNRALVTQLQNQAAGRGPSLAEQTYRNASQDQTANLAALSHIGGYAGARNAALQQGRIG